MFTTCDVRDLIFSQFSMDCCQKCVCFRVSAPGPAGVLTAPPNPQLNKVNKCWVTNRSCPDRCTCFHIHLPPSYAPVYVTVPGCIRCAVALIMTRWRQENWPNPLDVEKTFPGKRYLIQMRRYYYYFYHNVWFCLNTSDECSSICVHGSSYVTHVQTMFLPRNIRLCMNCIFSFVSYFKCVPECFCYV